MSSLQQWDYKILQGNKQELRMQVIELLDEGYEVCGGVAYSNGTFAQAVMRNPKNSSNEISGGKHRKSKKYNLKRKNKTKKRQF